MKSGAMKSSAMKISAIATAVVLTFILALPYVVNIDRFRPQLESTLSSSLKRDVHLGHMELSLLAGGARVEQISIADDPAFNKDAFLQAKSVGLGVSLWSLIFSRSLHVTSLTIEEPKMTAIKSAMGKWNFASIGSVKKDSDGHDGNDDSDQDDDAPPATASMMSSSSSSSLSSMVLDRVKISNATVELGSGIHAAQKATLKNVNVDLKNVSLNSAITFSLSAAAGEGKLQIEGNAGPIQTSPASAKDDGDDGDEDTDTNKDKGIAVHMKVNGNRVPLDSVEIFLPALGIVLPGGSTLRGGTVTAKLTIDGSIDHPVTSGNVEIAKAHLKGFDLGKQLSKIGAGSALEGSDLTIANLSTNLHVAATGTRISEFKGSFGGIGSITGDGEVNASNHLQFKMVAHVPSDGAVRFGLNHVGLKNVPNDVPFQVVGTTAAPIVIPELSGMAKNSAKSVASNAAKGAIKKAAANNTQTAPQSASAKKGGFFHNLFHKKDKQGNAASSTQLASQNTKY
jgi:AsmA protein